MIDKILNLAQNTDDYTLSELIRYSGKTKIKNESVAEHSFMVSIIILQLGQILNLPSSVTQRATIYGLLHDVPEQYFGDMAYEVKSNPDFKETIQDLEHSFNQQIYDNIYSDKYGDIMYNVMFDKNTIEDRLVKLADSIAVVQYSERELELGNTSKVMLRINRDAKDRVQYDYERLQKVLTNMNN